MNKMTDFYPKFLEFQIVCRGPQMTPSQAACSPRAASLRPLNYTVSSSLHGINLLFVSTLFTKFLKINFIFIAY